jgi:hypothetical protein
MPYLLIGGYLNTLEGFCVLCRSLAKVNEVETDCKIAEAPVLYAYLTALEVTKDLTKRPSAFGDAVPSTSSCNQIVQF